ncbi:MAG: efflux RND transporter periplasmic adaptor subunit [Desulfomonile tiedjei]|nr:efflux RND transporter periplasmic adaptor subunit [Desulfomonile tiedjei]
MIKKEFIAICVVLIVGLAAAVVVGLTDRKPSVSGHEHGHGHGAVGDDHAHDAENGPHGGKLLKDGPFELELSIYEKGVPPHFRAYAYHNHKPVDPSEVKVTVELERLGDKVTVFDLRPDAEFLFSKEEIDEPHSFVVKVFAEWRGEKIDWEYSQFESRLTLSPDLGAKMGITSAVAGPGTIKSILELPGEIAFNADLVSHVVPRVAGVALECRKNLGDTVQLGEILAVIDSRELGEARSRYLVAAEREKLARYIFERSQRLWQKEMVPEKEFLIAQKGYLEEKIELDAAARKLVAMGLTEQDIRELADGAVNTLTHYAIRAAFNGLIVKKHLSPGEWVKEDAEIFVIADVSTVWADIVVYAKDLESVHIGQKATVKTDASGLEAEGKVFYLGPLVGEDSRTARARVVIANPDGKWRPGLFAKVELVREQVEVPVVVQTDAIQSLRNGPIVFVRYGDQYEARPVELGRSDGRCTEVLKGISAGEQYVVRNSFVLKSELGKTGMSHQH